MQLALQVGIAQIAVDARLGTGRGCFWAQAPHQWGGGLATPGQNPATFHKSGAAAALAVLEVVISSC
ncbi:hypothetical protein A8B82_07260 [Sulfitobacter sp. EhC04]|uniref:hypothetical protein n=1 Tax=Sulfitobacter sp. EhC04 TaxID=1849168 RepID=UPI0007F40C8B|nr:hypothetical protein [Sulfitobacter sp. EhC04]OAN80022.1 hypothetical protein A8B82_07260 [Sulfitobacter sp. EhC04]